MLCKPFWVLLTGRKVEYKYFKIKLDMNSTQRSWSRFGVQTRILFFPWRIHTMSVLGLSSNHLFPIHSTLVPKLACSPAIWTGKDAFFQVWLTSATSLIANHAWPPFSPTIYFIFIYLKHMNAAFPTPSWQTIRNIKVPLKCIHETIKQSILTLKWEGRSMSVSKEIPNKQTKNSLRILAEDHDKKGQMNFPGQEIP